MIYGDIFKTLESWKLPPFQLICIQVCLQILSVPQTIKKKLDEAHEAAWEAMEKLADEIRRRYDVLSSRNWMECMKQHRKHWEK